MINNWIKSVVMYIACHWAFHSIILKVPSKKMLTVNCRKIKSCAAQVLPFSRFNEGDCGAILYIVRCKAMSREWATMWRHLKSFININVHHPNPLYFQVWRSSNSNETPPSSQPWALVALRSNSCISWIMEHIVDCAVSLTWLKAKVIIFIFHFLLQKYLQQ